MSLDDEKKYEAYAATRNEMRRVASGLGDLIRSMESDVEISMQNAAFVTCARATGVDEAVAAMELVTKQTEAVEAAARLLNLVMHTAHKTQRATMELARKAVGARLEEDTHKKAYAQGQEGRDDV